jgi:hypothetical protein
MSSGTTMVARGRDDALAPCRGAQLGEEVVRPAQLEGADALEVLSLEQDAAARFAVQRRAGEHQRTVADAVEAPVRRRNLFGSNR